MLKRILLLSAIALSACGDPSSQNQPQETEDNFLTQLRADYPVTLSKVGDKTWVHTTNYTLPGHCLLYTSPSPRDQRGSRMPSSA